MLANTEAAPAIPPERSSTTGSGKKVKLLWGVNYSDYLDEFLRILVNHEADSLVAALLEDGRN